MGDAGIFRVIVTVGNRCEMSGNFEDPAVLPTKKMILTPTEGAGCVPEAVSKGWKREQFYTLAGN